MDAEKSKSMVERFTLQGGVTELREKVIALNEIVDKTRKISDFLEPPGPRDDNDSDKREEPDTPLKLLKFCLDDLGGIIRTMDQSLADIGNNLGG